MTATTLFSTDDIDPAVWRDLLVKTWMTHDAMWFGQAVMRHGIDEANEMNCGAVRAMGAVEAKRVMRLLDLSQVAGPGDLRHFFDAAISLVIPSFMNFVAVWADDSTSVTFHITLCFAHDGVESLGVLDSYRCGIYPRMYGWLDTLGVGFEVVPGEAGCVWSGHDGCHRTLSFTFPDSAPGVANVNR